MVDKDKRNWPLDVLKSRRKLLQLMTKSVKETNVKEAYFSFSAIYDELPYFFIIREFTDEGASSTYKVVLKPTTSTNPNEVEKYSYSHQLGEFFKEWLNYVDDYIEQLSFENDSIIQGYVEEYFENYIIDDDANTHSYKTDVQHKIDEICSNTIKLLNAYAETHQLTEEKKAEIESIIESVEELQETQTQLVKQQVLNKAANIWARMKKFGIRLYDDAKAELFKEIIKQSVKGLLENPGEAGDFIKSLIS